LHDAIQLEEQGIPATVIITEPFQTLVASTARNLGAPRYPTVVVPHPIASKDEDHLRSLAHSVAGTVHWQLTE
jgi:hypothetical protein